MSTYIARVELLGTPPPSSYDKLHAEMKEIGFNQDDGGSPAWALPHATYINKSSTENLETVNGKVKVAAQKVQTNVHLITVEVASWTGLKQG